MVSRLNAALYYEKNLPEVKAIVESFEGSGILVTQAKVSQKTTGLGTPLLHIKEKNEYLAKRIKTMKSAKCALK